MPPHSRKPRVCIRTIHTRSLHLLRHKESRNASWRFAPPGDAGEDPPFPIFEVGISRWLTLRYLKNISKNPFPKKQHTFFFNSEKKGNTTNTFNFFGGGRREEVGQLVSISRSCSASFLPWNFDPSRLTRDNYLVGFLPTLLSSQSGNPLPKYRGKKHQVRL